MNKARLGIQNFEKCDMHVQSVCVVCIPSVLIQSVRIVCAPSVLIQK
jgi:hypothetical protein